MEFASTFCLCGVYLIFSLGLGCLFFRFLKSLIEKITNLKFQGKYPRLSTIISLMIAITIAGVIFYSAFSRLFPDYYYPVSKPQQKDIIGEWTFTSVSHDSLAENGYLFSTHKLSFFENGDFSVINIPDTALDINQHIYCSGNGTWKLDQEVDGQWAVVLTFSKIDTNCVQNKNDAAQYVIVKMDIYNRKPPYLIYFGRSTHIIICYQKIGKRY